MRTSPTREHLSLRRHRSWLTAVVLGLLSGAAGVEPADAGCGCIKPPPAPAQVRPHVAYTGGRVTIFNSALRANSIYDVTFTSGTAAGTATVRGIRAVALRDLANGQVVPQLRVALPALPLGPTAIRVYPAGSTTALVTINDASFTVIPLPVAVSEDMGIDRIPGLRAAVTRGGVVYVSLDVTGVQLPRSFEAQLLGYPLRFTRDKVLFYNAQGFLMQRLGENMPGLFSIGAGSSTKSDKLQYSRHEFSTYFLEHEERETHHLDPADPDWHLDGTRHIDHDHLIVAISGKMPNGSLPVPGSTPLFELELATLSFFEHGIFGRQTVDLGGKTGTTSTSTSMTNPEGEHGDVTTNGLLKTAADVVIDGNVSAASFAIDSHTVVTGDVTQLTQPLAFLPVAVPLGLTNLGSVYVQNTDTRTLTKGSYKLSWLKVASDATLAINNSAGPVTLYLTGMAEISGRIVVADPNPEKFALYVAGSGPVKIENDSSYYGVVYAPDALVEVSGTGQFLGAVVGSEVKVQDDSIMIYDVDLKNGQTLAP